MCPNYGCNFTNPLSDFHLKSLKVSTETSYGLGQLLAVMVIFYRAVILRKDRGPPNENNFVWECILYVDCIKWRWGE